jgi:hypothetical protein
VETISPFKASGRKRWTHGLRECQKFGQDMFRLEICAGSEGGIKRAEKERAKAKRL